MRVAVIKKIFGWLDIDVFRRDRSPPKIIIKRVRNPGIYCIFYKLLLSGIIII